MKYNTYQLISSAYLKGPRHWILHTISLFFLVVALSNSSMAQPFFSAESHLDTTLKKLDFKGKSTNITGISSWLENHKSSPMYLVNFIKFTSSDSGDSQEIQRIHHSKMKRILKGIGGRFHSVLQTQMTFDSTTGDEWDLIEVVYLPRRNLLPSLINTAEYTQTRNDRASSILEVQSYLIEDADEDNPFDERQDDPMKQEFYMVNLNEYRDFADYGEGPTDVTGWEANQLYMSLITPMLNEISAQFILAGSVVPVFTDENTPLWQILAVIRYPSESEFYTTVSSPEFQEAIVNKWAAIKNNSTTMTQKMPKNRHEH
ncbi:MAG: hypothetical protein V7785_12960 [Bermanella sp.]